MAFQEIASLDADVTVALGKTDKKTGKPYPKQAEGYYLGTRKVENKRGECDLHFLQTQKGNLGVWGTTDLNRKISQVRPGTMVRITSTGTKPTPNGDMYTYKVESDKTNTIEVDNTAVEFADTTSDDAYTDATDANDVDTDVGEESLRVAMSRKEEVESLLGGRKTK